MKDLETKVVDNYQEHSFHSRPYWKQMGTCSTCFTKHSEAKKRFEISFGRITGNAEINLIGNPNFAR